MVVTERVVDYINGIPCEVEYRDETGQVVGYWAYGYWDPNYPFGEQEWEVNENDKLLYRAHVAGACDATELWPGEGSYDCKFCEQDTQILESLLGDPEGQMEFDESCENEYDSQLCHRPPPGWWCSRDPGHDGPCAARPL